MSHDRIIALLAIFISVVSIALTCYTAVYEYCSENSCPWNLQHK